MSIKTNEDIGYDIATDCVCYTLKYNISDGEYADPKAKELALKAKAAVEEFEAYMDEYIPDM